MPEGIAYPRRRRLLIVEDDVDFAEALIDILAMREYDATALHSAEAAIRAIEQDAPPVAMLDIRLGLSSGVDLLARLRADHPNLICVMMTAHVDVETAIAALRRGAYDYVDKSCNPDQLLAVLDRCFEKVELQREWLAALEELKAAKDAAVKASQAKSEFLATVSHELRTPLNAIIGFSEVIMRETLGPVGNEQYRNYMKDIHESGVHLLEIINDILDLTKAEAGKLELVDELVDLQPLIAACCRLMRQRAETARLDFVTEIPRLLPILRGDSRKIKQVLINLLSNSIKFTPPGGRVEIRAEFDAARRLVIAVSDTGIGISEADQARVFQPFVQVDSSLTRRHQGTGLGLSLVRAMVELHGGEVALESALGVGTRVAITFPPSCFVEESGAEGPDPAPSAALVA
jgi:signal transduction histidine kinase